MNKKIKIDLNETIEINVDNFKGFCIEQNCGKKYEELAKVEFIGLRETNKITKRKAEVPLIIHIPLCKKHSKLYNRYLMAIKNNKNKEVII